MVEASEAGRFNGEREVLFYFFAAEEKRGAGR